MKTAIIMYGRTIEGGGGAERRFIRVFEKFKEEKNNPVFLVVNKSLYCSFYKLKLLKSSEKVIIIEDSGFFNKLNFNFQLIRLLLSYKKFNIVHLVLIQKSLIPLYFFLWFYKTKKFKVVSTVANYRIAYRKGLSLFESFLYFLYQKASNHIDSLYPSIVNPNKSLSITPCPFTDYSQFKPKKKENIVLFAGRLQPYKNPMVFIEAVFHLIENNDLSILKTWRFFVCGSGPLEDEINKRIKEKGYEEWFCIGKCSDMTDLMGRSKVFVSLQTYENYPSQSLIEAIVTQNNIVVTDVGDTRLLFAKGAAYFIDLNPIELSETLLDIFSNGGFSEKKLEETSKNFISKNNINAFKDYLISIWSE